MFTVTNAEGPEFWDKLGMTEDGPPIVSSVL